MLNFFSLIRVPFLNTFSFSFSFKLSAGNNGMADITQMPLDAGCIIKPSHDDSCLLLKFMESMLGQVTAQLIIHLRLNRSRNTVFMVKLTNDMMHFAPLTIITGKPGRHQMLSTKCLTLGLRNRVWEYITQVSETIKRTELCSHGRRLRNRWFGCLFSRGDVYYKLYSHDLFTITV